MTYSRAALVAALVLSAPAVPALAQTVSPGELRCLPIGDNGLLTATVTPPPAAESSVRLYFRRLNLVVEDFYFTEMVPTGGGAYWGVFPQAENSKLPRKPLEGATEEENAWAEWWRAKEASDHRDPNRDLPAEEIAERAAIGKREPRDWMAETDDPALERFLEAQSTEPAEYFVAVVDPDGREIARSPMRIVEVRDGCRPTLTPQQVGYAMNLTVGETAPWQAGRAVFHWQCTGVVTRLDPQQVLRGDDACRACVVAWWPKATAAGAVLGVLGIITIDDPDDPEVSPSRP
jgi:hypothetical protein